MPRKAKPAPDLTEDEKRRIPSETHDPFYPDAIRPPAGAKLFVDPGVIKAADVSEPGVSMYPIEKENYVFDLAHRRCSWLSRETFDAVIREVPDGEAVDMAAKVEALAVEFMGMNNGPVG